MSKTHCYHCGLPVPDHLQLSVTIQGQPQPMCCPGCQAVAQTIIDAGLSDFYSYRTEHAPTGQVLVPEFLEHITVYDNPTVQKQFVRCADEHIREATLILEGITCAACVWLNERHLKSLPGVFEVRINYSTHRAHIRWDDSQIRLSDILKAISQIGYLAHPYDPARQQALLDAERKQHLRRLGIAGVLGMQVMMFSVALYAGDWYGIEKEFKLLFYWINLILTLPILLYCAQPFFSSAWRDLRLGQAGMDVPVSLGITLAFVGSVWTTLQLSHSPALAHQAHVYYDSIAMFVFFLLTARYFELLARQRSIQAAEHLIHLVPTTATRLVNTAHFESVLVAELNIGDEILVRPGEAIPIDGRIRVGHSSINESLLTGEHYPLSKGPGEQVIAGSINIDNPLHIQVEKIGADTILSHILRLLERAQTEKPALTQLANRVAAWFVVAVLVLAVAVGLYWWLVAPTLWLPITLSVLVVTCPCALSLATPTAMTAATSALTQVGLLITRGHALETLARVNHFIFDKTGTLTEGQLQLSKIRTLAAWTPQHCLDYAAALEQHSEHPIAQALLAAARSPTVSAYEVENSPGAGLQGYIADELYFIGTPEFIAAQTGLALTTADLEALHARGDTLILLASRQTLYALFLLTDRIRQGTQEVIQTLQQQGYAITLLSGDQPGAVQQVAQAVGIQDAHAGLTPAEKLRHVKALQAQGAVVAMIGDGVNDAPVLAQAQVSIAMGSGTQIARASADMILLAPQLAQLLTGIKMANKTLTVIRQNIIWAIGYNVIALPAAAMGLVAPWLAALGMSCSSLIVVTNALRLAKKRP